MRYVSPFEAHLLRIAHAIVGRAQAVALVVREEPPPACLSRDTVEALKDVLAKGVTEWLVRSGGWKQTRFVRGGAVVAGRLWQRTSPADLGLVFSEYSLEFLLWLTAANVQLVKHSWEPLEPALLTLGDRLLLVMALDALADTEIGTRWAQSPTFRGDGLCALLHPQLMAASNESFAPNFAPWLTPCGVAVIETLQQRLAARWLQVERDKSKLVVPQQMQAIARAQRRLVEQFLAAIRAAGRDLGRWLLIVAQQLFACHPSAERWTSSLDVKSMRLADRTDVYRDAVSLVRSLASLENWQREAANVGYFDEEYAAMQLWKSDWETFRGDASCAAAREVLRQVEPLGAL